MDDVHVHIKVKKKNIFRKKLALFLSLMIRRSTIIQIIISESQVNGVTAHRSWCSTSPVTVELEAQTLPDGSHTSYREFVHAHR